MTDDKKLKKEQRLMRKENFNVIAQKNFNLKTSRSYFSKKKRNLEKKNLCMICIGQ